MGGAYAASGLGATLDLGYAAAWRSTACSTARTPAGWWSPPHPAQAAALAALAKAHGVPLFRAGRVGGRALELRAGSRLFTWDVAALRRTYFEAIPRRMQHADAERSAGE